MGNVVELEVFSREFDDVRSNGTLPESWYVCPYGRRDGEAIIDDEGRCGGCCWVDWTAFSSISSNPLSKDP